MSWRALLWRQGPVRLDDGDAPAVPSSRVTGAKAAYIVTFAAEAIVAVSYLMVFRIVAHRSGAQGFGEYALSRRTLSLLGPVCSVSLDVAVARYVSYGGRPGHAPAGSYLSAALLLLGGVTIPATAVLLGFAPFWANLFFGGPQYVGPLTAVPLLLAGINLHAVIYGYFRGRLWLGRASVLTVVNQGVVPIVAALSSNGSVTRLLFIMGGLWLLISLAVLALTPLSFSKLRLGFRQLVRYGAARVPGDQFRLALLALPSIFIAHVSGIKDAGVVAFGVAVLGLAATSLMPVSLVLLPVAARYISAGERHNLRIHVLRLAAVATGALILFLIVFEAFTTFIVTSYLGPDFVSNIILLRVTMIGVLPWGLYIILRSVIDAHHTRAVNGRNSAVAFACFISIAVATRIMAPSTIGIVVAFVAGLWVLGVLTVFECLKVLRVQGVTSEGTSSV